MPEPRCDACGTLGRRARYVAPATGAEQWVCAACLSALIDRLLADVGALLAAVRDSPFVELQVGEVDHLRALGELRAAWLARGPEQR